MRSPSPRVRPERFAGLEPALVRLLLPIAEDRFSEQVAALPWWPAPRRATGLTLLAFAAELATIPDKVSEPTLGAMRFAFWREVLAELEEGRVRAHPVVEGLSAVRAQGSLPHRRELMGLIDAAETALPEAEGMMPHMTLNAHLLPLLGRACGANPEDAGQLTALGCMLDRPAGDGPSQIGEEGAWRAVWQELLPLPPVLAPIAGAARLSFLQRVSGRKSLFGQRLSLLITILRGR